MSLRECFFLKFLHIREMLNMEQENTPLAYMQLFIWSHYYPKIIPHALILFVKKYGSWRDIPYFCQYVLERTGNQDHQLIILATQIMLNELSEGKNKLAAKWAPREKSKFHWLFKKMAYLMFHHFLDSAKTVKALYAAKRKAKTKFRHIIKQNTLEHQLCSKQMIDFTKLSPSTLINYSPTFQRRFAAQFAFFLDNTQFTENYLHLGEKLTRAAYHKKASPALLNKLWVTKPIELGHTIALLHSSASMLNNYAAIALAIRIAEEAREPLRNQIILFSQQPKLICFTKKQTFTQKVEIIKQEMEGLGDKIYPAIRFLANELKKITKYISNVKIIILSNMQVEPNYFPDFDSLSSNIKKIFNQKRLKLPKLIFWNMESSNGFPGLYFEKNVTMISGNNHNLLKYLPKTNTATTAYNTTITKILNSKRYIIMDHIITRYTL